jgi:hypothetical protein
MRRCELCGYHLDMHSELCERIQKEIARAEKAEAKVRTLESENDTLKLELALYKSVSSYPRWEE